MQTRLKSSSTTDQGERFPPVHPGEMLREEFLVPLGLSAHALSLALHVPATRIGDIVNERRAITADTAIRLGRYFGTSPQFWMNLQSHYDLEVALDSSEEAISREVHPAPCDTNGALLRKTA